MRPEEDREGSSAAWLRYARSDLELSRVSAPPEVLLEGLCFHAQQAAEKALKAILIDRGVPFPRTHSIGTLIDLMPQNLVAPNDVEDAASLTHYAVITRYPGVAEPVDEEEYRQAVHLAEAVVSWAEALMRG